ncbi:HNH endonuclease signature motif containing protein [Glutamicibacter sp. AOP5-A2-7]
MSTRIEQTVADLQAQLAGSGELSTPELLALSSLAASILPALRTASTTLTDPRAALALSTHTERLAHEAVRTQTHCAHLVEASGAHRLDIATLDALRAQATDYATAPAFAESRPSYKGATELLAAWLNLDIFEARRRVEDAHLVICQFDQQGNRCPAQFPRLAQRFATRGADPRETLSAARRLHKLEPVPGEFDAPGTACAQDASGQLVEEAAVELLEEPEPKTRSKKLNQLIKSAKATAAELEPESAAGIYRQGEKDGLIVYQVRLSALDAAAFESLLSQADNPRAEAGAASRQVESAHAPGAIPEHPDFVSDEQAAASTWNPLVEATVARRRLQGLMNLLTVNSKKLSRLLTARTAQKPSAGTPGEALAPADPEIPVVQPTIMVHLTLAELTGLAKTHGVTDSGFEMRPTDLRQALAKAKIIPLVLGGRGEILDIGREQRNFPKYMRRAIKARDRGCIVPGCTVPPEHCELHHIWWWSNGGPTAVYLGCCLCTGHHHDVHAGVLKVASNGGVPQVILPKFVDPTQTPQRNSINARRAA